MRTAGRETVHLLSKPELSDYEAETINVIRGKSRLNVDLLNSLVAKCKEEIPDVQTGIFGADMKISLVNDGPFTILLDSEDLA